MPQADKYEPGDEPTQTKGRRHAGASATGSNPGPATRPKPAKDDARTGTTSDLAPKGPAEEAPSDEKPRLGERFNADS